MTRLYSLILIAILPPSILASTNASSCLHELTQLLPQLNYSLGRLQEHGSELEQQVRLILEAEPIFPLTNHPLRQQTFYRSLDKLKTHRGLRSQATHRYKGQSARLFLPSFAKAKFNYGLIFIDDKDSPRVLKTIKLAPIFISHPYIGYLWDFRGAVIGQNTGGPQVYNAGFVLIEGQKYFFIETEELFPKEQMTTLKELVDKRGSFRLQDLPEITQRKIISKIAETIKIYSYQQIFPWDIDFAITTHGEVRPIDTAHFRPWNNPKEFHAAIYPLKRYLRELHPTYERQFNKEIKTSSHQ